MLSAIFDGQNLLLIPQRHGFEPEYKEDYVPSDN